MKRKRVKSLDILSTSNACIFSKTGWPDYVSLSYSRLGHVGYDKRRWWMMFLAWKFSITKYARDANMARHIAYFLDILLLKAREFWSCAQMWWADARQQVIVTSLLDCFCWCLLAVLMSLFYEIKNWGFILFQAIQKKYGAGALKEDQIFK